MKSEIAQSAIQNKEDEVKHQQTMKKLSEEVEKEDVAEALPTAETQPEAEAEEKWLAIQIHAPNEETIRLEQISLSDTILSIRQLIAEHPSLVSYTAYHFELVQKDGTKSVFNDFVEFGEYEEILSDNIVLNMVLDPYDFRKVQEHVRRLRETLVNPPVSQASVIPTVSQRSNVEENKKDTDEAKANGISNEEAIKKKLENMRKIQDNLATVSIPVDCRLSNLYNVTNSSSGTNSVTKEKKKKKEKNDENPIKTLPTCMKSLVFSGYNPPPGNRKLSGDLCYLEFTTLDNEVYHITANIAGFYVNMSTSKSFNPSRNMSYTLSHTLLDVLCSCSKSFSGHYKQLLEVSADMANAGPFSIENMTAFNNSLGKLEWTVPVNSSLTTHEYDLNRAQEQLSENFGVDKGVLRDWNEEYQCCRELPKETLKDRIVRSRVMYKVLTEFVEAATHGAIAVIEGNIPPVNPMDSEKAHVFVFNNIFYSLATDNKCASKEAYGDETAFSSANNDLQGVIAYSQADVTGLHTLATVIVDYLGVRVVAQSIIPGILQGDAASKLVYGSIDGGKTVKSDEKMHELMIEAGKKLHIGEREIVPEEAGSESLKICGAVEAKGILGSDGRMYILDLVRTTPRDAIFYHKVEQEKSDVEGLNFPRDDDYIAILRPEILELYSMWKQSRAENLKKESENAKARNNSETETEANQEKTAEENLENPSEKSDTGTAVGQNEISSPLLFNPNVFNNTVAMHDVEQSKADEADAIEVAYYLQNVVIPAFITDIRRGSMLPIDGHILTDTMHSCGINMRYLGRLAVLCARLEENEGIGKYVLELLETEMIARSLKHILFEIVSSCDEIRLAPITLLCRLLNCLFGNVNTVVEPETEDNTIKKKGSKSKKNKMKNDVANLSNGNINIVQKSDSCVVPVYDSILTETTQWTSQSLWSAIEEDISKKYAYKLRLWPAKNNSEQNRTHPLPMLRRVCQKLGLRVLCRDYDFSSPTPFTIDDIVNVVPVVKSSLPKQPLNEAKLLLDRGRLHLTTGSLGEAYEMLQESATLLYQVCGAAHEDAALCCSSLAMVLYHAGDYTSALVQQQRALSLYAQLMGVDYHDTVFAHINLALFLHALGRVDEAVNHLQRAISLFQLLGGPHLTEISALYSKMGSMIQEVGHISLSLLCYRESLRHGDIDRLTAASTLHQMATACAMAGGFREALTYEKKSYGLLKDTLGEDDVRVKECAKYMAKFTEKAVEGAKGRKELDSAAEAERLANEIAKQLVLDAEKEDNSKKSKKSKKQKNSISKRK